MMARSPGEMARAEQQLTGCQRMLDEYISLAQEVVQQHGCEPAVIWASVARAIIDDRTHDEVGEEVIALAGVFSAAVVELLQRRSSAG